MSLHSKLTSTISKSQAEHEAQHKQKIENIKKEEMELKARAIQLLQDFLTDENLEKLFDHSNQYNMGHIITVILQKGKITVSRVPSLNAPGAIDSGISLDLSPRSAHEAVKSTEIQQRLSDLLKGKIKITILSDDFKTAFGLKIEVMPS